MLPEKKMFSRKLVEQCNQGNPTELHNISNGTVGRIEAMQARSGTFVKWTSGLNGVVSELVESVKVDGKAEEKSEGMQIE
jgi:hypothetical protein